MSWRWQRLTTSSGMWCAGPLTAVTAPYPTPRLRPGLTCLSLASPASLPDEKLGLDIFRETLSLVLSYYLEPSLEVCGLCVT